MTEVGAPHFTLKLGGEELTQDHLRNIISIEFVEAVDKLDALNVQFAVPTVDRDNVLRWAELGLEFELAIGYAGSGNLREGWGDITEISHAISPSAPQTITLTGLDALHRLKGKSQSKVWEVSHSDIVTSIAGEHDLTAVVDGVEGSPTHTLQDNQTDAVFLRHLAKEHNYNVRVINQDLRFSRATQAYEPDTITVNWNRDVENIQLRASINDLVSTVKVKGRNYAQNEDIAAEANAVLENISGGELGIDIVSGVFGEREHLIDHARRNQTSSADERAARELEERAQKFLTGSITVLGKPEAMSGAKIEVDAITYPFMGPFLITQTTHTLEPGVGYRTKIDFCSNSWPVNPNPPV